MQIHTNGRDAGKHALHPAFHQHGPFLLLQGRAWEEGGVLVGPEYGTPPADPFRPSAVATAAAAAATQDLQLTVSMPKAVAPGESVSAVIEVVSLKSKAGGAPVELILDPIPPSMMTAGMLHGTLCWL